MPLDPLPDSTIIVSKNSSKPNSSLTVRNKGSSAITQVKYINYQMVTVPGSFTITG
jgi:hypothetical protein